MLLLLLLKLPLLLPLLQYLHLLRLHHCHPFLKLD
jgi:hypothetical protein